MTGLVDIYTEHRKRIRAKDWNRIHAEGDRRAPVAISTRRWTTTGEASRVEKGGNLD